MQQITPLVLSLLFRRCAGGSSICAILLTPCLTNIHIYLQGAAVTPGRINNGLDWKRLQLILGVLNKHTQLRPYAADVYVNVLGGGLSMAC